MRQLLVDQILPVIGSRRSSDHEVHAHSIGQPRGTEPFAYIPVRTRQASLLESTTQGSLRDDIHDSRYLVQESGCVSLEPDWENDSMKLDQRACSNMCCGDVLAGRHEGARSGVISLLPWKELEACLGGPLGQGLALTINRPL